ncbi:cytochrome b/b6 domain-containing protein [Extensimonas vulgaris]|uniref:Cytochrome b n=1 Tax=Extensimonas vulgaris TaxID=1031594 RepID=A0A369AHG7_9BURK|nr:cytochrome b/b6 domain-containing protein [Extensimonas vulgaris]RCX06884.1 cytochrome b [Extensimonas vulgaris]TWI33703.1 cytochrome b [Extensimonas vulgaris]TXD12546.1 cytochrome B [Extensimonas vulgaris]
MAYTVRVWDLPTRLFHWALVLCVVGLVVTGEVGDNAMVWHFRFGYTVLALLLFRLAWGFVGGYWSRFGTFLSSPARALRYLRGIHEPTDMVGHNPLGAWSVLAMLLLLAAQVGSGLMSDDEIAFAGPLTRFVSGATVELATAYHTEVGKVLLLALVTLHVLAIVFYTVKKKQKLVPPMLHGDKQLPTPAPAARDDVWTRLGALLLFGLCAAAAWWVSRLDAL